jgi:hypothetical protein
MVEPDSPVTGANQEGPGAPGSPPPGIREQISATIGAVKRLVRAHLELAKAELGEIVGEVKRMVALAGVALGAVLMLAFVLTLGGLLFLGDWLFGSIGWGVLLGAFLLIDVAVVAALAAVGSSSGRLGLYLGISLVVGAVVGFVLGADLAHRGWTSLGESIAPTLDPSTRPTIVAVGVVAAIGAVLGLVARLRGGVGAAFGGLVAGAIVGALVGWLTSTAISGTVGAALGTWVALLLWPILAGVGVARRGIDTEALRQRFVPDQTIETTKETIEWVRARTPLTPKP